MVDYQKKTVVDLTEILKSRSLPHTGKKAELVARLNEADKAQGHFLIILASDHWGLTAFQLMEQTRQSLLTKLRSRMQRQSLWTKRL